MDSDYKLTTHPSSQTVNADLGQARTLFAALMTGTQWRDLTSAALLNLAALLFAFVSLKKNSVEYVPSGKDLTVSLEFPNKSSLRLELWCNSTGCGQLLKHVFKMYFVDKLKLLLSIQFRFHHELNVTSLA